MFNTLSYIADKLNKEGILWGVGASLLLNHYGLVDKPNDIDLLVSEKDIIKVDQILQSIGEKKVREEVQAYSTSYFYEYTVNKIDIDVMAGLKINCPEGVFAYIFDQESIVGTKDLNGINIPLMSLEDWYIIYQLMPNREEKVKMIEDYLLENGVKHINLLERAKKMSPRKLQGDII